MPRSPTPAGLPMEHEPLGQRLDGGLRVRKLLQLCQHRAVVECRHLSSRVARIVTGVLSKVLPKLPPNDRS